jgi:hypothetical protein
VLLPGGTLVGRVRDAGGAPIARAAVRACPPQGPPDPEARAAVRIWLPYASFGEGLHAETSTAEDGGFRIEGVPAVALEIFASDRVHLVGRSGRLELHAGEELRVPDLVLPDAEDGDRIAGTVLGEDGRPCGFATLWLMDEDESVSYGSGARSALDGSFALLALPGRAYMVGARDPTTRREAKARGVRAGERALVLRFAARGTLALAVRDARGPVAGFRAVVTSVELRGLSGHASDSPGTVRVDVPDQTFYVNVVSPEHQPLRLGPFEPGAAPARLEAVLERAEGIAGVVRAEGSPVPGAVVHAHVPVQGASLWELPEGLVSRVDPGVDAATIADEQGRFFLPLFTSGRFLVHASAPGRARAASDWLEFPAGASLPELELELPPAGALEGRVLVAPGVEPSGLWIAASDGEGHVELTQSGAEGAFRFDGLAPGAWQVRRVRAGQERTFLQLAERGGCRPLADEGEPVSDVRLGPGAVARFDLDLRHEVPCRIEGRLAFGGAPASGWNAALAGSQVPLDTDGRFVLRASEPGRSWLVLWGGAANLSVELVVTAGTNVWELDLPVGELQLENLPRVSELDADSSNRPAYELTWSGGDLRWSATLHEEPSASLRLAQVPAGRLALRVRPAGGQEDPRGWPVLVELDLAAGAFESVRLP